MFNLEQLPQSWLLRFVELLPSHLKLKLRQCSRSWLDLVDGSSKSRLKVTLPIHRNVGDSFAADVVLDLMCKHVVALDVSALSASEARRMRTVVEAAALREGAAVLLPRLKHVTVQLSQVKLLSAIAAATAAGSVKYLSLWCCDACRMGYPTDMGHPGDGAHAVVEKLAAAGESLAASVEALAYLGGHHCLAEDHDEDYFPVAPFVQQLTNLKTLAIPDCADDYADSFQEGLDHCLSPLHGLTLLHIGGSMEGIDMAGGGMCIDLRHLTALQDLSFNTTHSCTITTAGLKLLPGCSAITALQLTGDLYDFDIGVLAGLPHLQKLSLFTEHEFESDDFQALTACSKLTSLTTDNITINPTTPEHGAAAAAAVTPASSASAGSAPGLSTQHSPAMPHAKPLPAAAAAAGGAQPGSKWSLASLEHLSIGNVGLVEYLAPLSTFAPNLTRLQDTFWDSLPVRPSSSRGAADVDALAGLQQLQVLDVDLFTLDRHAGHLAGLTGLSTLQQLEVEMVGDGLASSVNLQDGLPCMPYLTKLLMYTQEDVRAGDWQDRYDSQEDLMLFQNQGQLKELAIKGSSRVGGFLVDANVSQQLRQRLPALQCVRIELCPDLDQPALAQFVAVSAAPLVLVVGCKPVSERECLLSTELVKVEFC